MIPAIDPGFGLTEDRPAPRTSPPGDSGFAHVLHRTSDPERTDSERPTRDARPAGDTRAREAYGRRHEQRPAHDARASDGRGADGSRDTDDSQETSADKAGSASGKAGSAHAGKDAKKGENAQQGKAANQDKDTAQSGKADAKSAAQSLQAAAAQAAIPTLQPATTSQPAPSGEVPQPGAAGLVETPQALGPHFAGPEDTTPINAQIGRTAYQLGVHGEGEAQLAAAAGVPLPGTPQAKLAEAGVTTAQQTALQKAKVTAPPQVKEEGAPVGLAGIVQAAQAHPAGKGGPGSVKDQVALQTAQARNEVLSRLAATGGDGSAQAQGQGLGQGLAQGNADGLRQQLQLHGLLARDARLHTLEPTSANAPPTTVAGLAQAPNGVPVPQPPTHDDANAQRTIEKVASEARWLINNNRQQVTLRLSPDHLGDLHLKVQHENGVFHIHLTVDSAAAKHLLESNLQDLRNQLSGDHPGGQFFFNVDVRHGHDQPGMYQRSGRMPVAGVGGHAAGLEQAASPTLARRLIGQSGLSIYV